MPLHMESVPLWQARHFGIPKSPTFFTHVSSISVTIHSTLYVQSVELHHSVKHFRTSRFGSVKHFRTYRESVKHIRS